MSDIPIPEPKDGNTLETFIGLCVVILATFLGVVNVKDGNISQKMQQMQTEHNDNWGWYQARKIRMSVFESFAEELSIPRPGESDEIKKLREGQRASFQAKFEEQKRESKDQAEAAKNAKAEYDTLNSKGDQFGICEVALTIGLALMGVTALAKRWWLFVVALVPSVFGVGMGIAGFLGVDTDTPAINWLIEALS